MKSVILTVGLWVIREIFLGLGLQGHSAVGHDGGYYALKCSKAIDKFGTKPHNHTSETLVVATVALTPETVIVIAMTMIAIVARTTADST